MSEYLPIVFMTLGCVYFTIGIIDYIRWWNGMDNEGNPK